MPSSNFTAQLIHTCDIQRKVTNGTGLGNQPGFTWNETFAKDVPCLIEWTTSIEIVNGKKVVVVTGNIMFEAGVDITEDDRILFGTQIMSLTLVRPARIRNQTHHIEAVIDEIREATQWQ